MLTAIGFDFGFSLNSMWDFLCIAVDDLSQPPREMKAGDTPFRDNLHAAFQRSQLDVLRLRRLATELPEHKNDEIAPLSAEKKYILVAMLEMQLFSQLVPATQSEIAIKAKGPMVDGNSMKKTFSSLVKEQLIDSKSGPGGGHWLTARGNTLARSIESQGRDN